MSASIAYYIDTPAIQQAMQRWGNQFQRLSPADRFEMIELLARAAADLVKAGESWPLAGTAQAEVVWDGDEPQILEFLAGIDQEFTSPGQCAALIAAIATSLQFTVFPLDQAG